MGITLACQHNTVIPSMIRNARSLNDDFSHWQTYKVNRMESMFEDTTILNNNGNLEEISIWDIAHSDTMYRMFVGSSSFRNHYAWWNIVSVVYNTSLTTAIIANITNISYVGTNDKNDKHRVGTGLF